MADQNINKWQLWANEFKRLTGADFIMVCEYKDENESLISRAVSGIPEVIYRIAAMVKQDVVGYEWVLADGVYENLISQEVIELDSIHEASSYHIPHFVGYTIEKSIGLGGIYSIGFVSENEPEKLLGNVVLIMIRGKKITSQESLIQLAQEVGRQLS